jgi:hypothetical protein
VLKSKYHKTISAKVTDRQRTAIDNLATSKGLSIGEVIRAVLDVGLKEMEC